VCGVFEHIKRHIWFKKSCPGKQLNKILTAVIMNVRVMMMLHVPASSFCSRITIFKNKFLFKINFFYVFEYFDMLIFKIKIILFDIILNKKYFKKQSTTYSWTSSHNKNR
jgi:hypothetical protein